MSNSTLLSLKAVESDLEEQIAALEEKLRGVRAILPMFENPSENTVELEAPEPEKTSSEATPIELDSSVSSDAELEESKPSKAVSQPSQARETKAKKGSKSTTRKKKDGRTASWQTYLRDGAKEKSMPEAVLFILQTQPEEPFKVADVMTALFEEDMPKAQYLKARNRISNVLSMGTRDGAWSRVGNGVYSLSDSDSVAA